MSLKSFGIGCLLSVLMTTHAFAHGDVPSRRLSHVLKLLSHPKPKVRTQAIAALSKWRDRRAVTPLVLRLKDAQPSVRAMAAHALGNIGDPEAIPALKAVVRDDRDKKVRHHAERSLHVLGASSASHQGKAVATNPARVYLRIGKMAAQPSTGKPLLALMRDAWKTQVTNHKSPQIKLAADKAPADGKIYEITSSITNLSSQNRGNTVETTCQVSMVLGDERGSIVMIGSGGATVEVVSRTASKQQTQKQAQENALRYAVASAHENLLKYLER